MSTALRGRSARAAWLGRAAAYSKWGLLLVGCWLLGLPLRAQPAPLTYGQVTGQDFAVPVLGADSAAEAVVLGDYGRARIDGTQEKFQVVFDRVTRVLIRKPSGFHWATQSVRLYNDGKGNWEKLRQLRGTTYNLVGGQLQRDTLTGAGVFEEAVSQHWRLKKFTLPQVRVGSIVEYRYTVVSDYLSNVPAWQFQHAVPVRWSEFRFVVPLFFNYNMVLQSALPLVANEHRAGVYRQALTARTAEAYHLSINRAEIERAHQATFSRWAMQNVPALPDVTFLPTYRDYQARLGVELMTIALPGYPVRNFATSWERIGEKLKLDEAFGRQLRGGSFLPAEVRALQKQFPDPAQRAAAVYRWAQQHVKYNGREELMPDQTLRQAYATGLGSAAEVNLLLVLALREAGLPADPVLASTRAHGRVNEQYPAFNSFNYVVAAVPQPGGPDLFLDATDALLPPGWLPELVHGVQGRVLASQGPDRWVTLEPGQRYVHLASYALQVNAAGRLQGQVHLEDGGYAALRELRALRRHQDRAYLTRRLTPYAEWRIAAARVQAPTEATQPLKVDFELAQEAAGQGLNTLLLKLPGQLPPALQALRVSPQAVAADFGAPQEWLNQVRLTLPPGYGLAALPAPLALALPNEAGRFQFAVTDDGAGQVQCTVKLQLRQVAFKAADCAALRELLAQAAVKMEEPLIIQKKEGSLAKP